MGKADEKEEGERKKLSRSASSQLEALSCLIFCHCLNYWKYM